MLQNIQGLYGDRLAASDGEIGRVKDFYYDDLAWVIRYVVVDTGTWLSHRQVLLSPHGFGQWDREGHSLPIRLTRKQVEDSPSIDAHRPVNRQDERDYYQHYGWPAYWKGGGMWGIAGFPVVDSSPTKRQATHHGHNQRDDLHLRSTKALLGYKIQAADGVIGRVQSVMVDDKSWAVAELVVETGHWYAGKEILVRSGKIERVSYEEATVFVNLSKAEIEQTANDSVVQVAPEL